MAQRRMFSLKVIDTDNFLDMPVSARELYFQFGMRADDDGFVANPKRIMKMIGASDDDFRVLEARKFVIPMSDNGVSVITHWKVNNFIRPDRYEATQFKEEKAKLSLVDGRYFFDFVNKVESGIPNDIPSIGKVSIGKDNNTSKEKREKTKYNVLGAEIIKAFESIDPKNKTYYGNINQRKSCDFLISEYGLDDVLKRISILDRTNKMPFFPKINSPSDLKEKWVKLETAVS